MDEEVETMVDGGQRFQRLAVTSSQAISGEAVTSRPTIGSSLESQSSSTNHDFGFTARQRPKMIEDWIASDGDVIG